MPRSRTARRHSIAGRAAIAVLAAVVAVTGLVACSSSSHPSATVHHSAAAAAHAFLSRYVDPDGRVVRRDQGGDTVSEGQGYAMLIAVAGHDRSLFARVWAWTQHNLQQPSALFAYHWADGHVVDATPATDADVQIAWALTLAGQRWHVSTWTAAARRIGAAVLSDELGYDDRGAPVLAAGPWALPSGKPVIAEPGYWTAPAEAALAALTGDNRWKDLPQADVTHVSELVQGGQRLPADWIEVGAGTDPTPVDTPGTQTSPQSGQDGMRALVWTSCTDAGKAVVARTWPLLEGDAAAAPLTRSLTGPPAMTDVSALSAVSAAASAGAAGHTATARALLRRADAIDAQYPTYYGAAWRALGWILLTTHDLPGCPAAVLR